MGVKPKFSKQFSKITIEQGKTVDFSNAQRFEFSDIGDVIVGILIDKKHMESPYDNTLYCLENFGGLWSFFGSTALNTKMGRVDIGDLIKIEYQGVKKSEKSAREYNDFQVWRFPLPDEFDLNLHTVELQPDGSILPLVKPEPAEKKEEIV